MCQKTVCRHCAVKFIDESVAYGKRRLWCSNCYDNTKAVFALVVLVVVFTAVGISFYGAMMLVASLILFLGAAN